MELSQSFEVARPIDETWATLTDVERVARCVPGAQLQEVDGRDFRGVIHVKLGPITTEYAGAATVIEQNNADHKVIVTSQGNDAEGEGRAEVVITAKLEAVSDHATQVNLDTDLTITGRVAQLGKGVIPEVSDTLVARFAENLDELLAAGGDTTARRRAPRRTVDMPAPEAIDLMDAARNPILKRLVGLALGALGLGWWIRRLRR
ncbi:MAG: SRPBCC family protein [Actinomycetota bacterium]